MAGNRLFGHQGQLARSRPIVVERGSALLANLLIGKMSEINKRAPLLRRPLTYGALTHEARKRCPYFVSFFFGAERTHRP